MHRKGDWFSQRLWRCACGDREFVELSVINWGTVIKPDWNTELSIYSIYKANGFIDRICLAWDILRGKQPLVTEVLLDAEDAFDLAREVLNGVGLMSDQMWVAKKLEGGNNGLLHEPTGV